MTFRSLVLFAAVALLGETGAFAESCKVQSSHPRGQWKFIRVYDPATGAIVLGQAVNGGDIKTVTVRGHRIKVEAKLPGAVHYGPAVEAACKEGHTVKI